MPPDGVDEENEPEVGSLPWVAASLVGMWVVVVVVVVVAAPWAVVVSGATVFPGSAPSTGMLPAPGVARAVATGSPWSIDGAAAVPSPKERPGTGASTLAA
jgi:hypothetical protein